MKANYLASPPLVVAYALAGTVDIDLDQRTARHGQGRSACLSQGYLAQLRRKISEAVARKRQHRECSQTNMRDVFTGSDMWKEIKVSRSDLYQWDEESTYIHHPPFFQTLTLEVPPIQDIQGARVLAVLATRSPPTTFPRPATSLPTARPGSSCRNTACSPRTSISTARGAAMTW